MHSVKRHDKRDELTQSSLRDLLGCQGKGKQKFCQYLDQNVGQGRRGRDPDISTKSAEEVLEVLENDDECVVAIVDVFDRLRNLDVTESCGLGSEKGTYGK